MKSYKCVLKGETKKTEKKEKGEIAAFLNHTLRSKDE
jgi:hypothetical protein